MLLLGLLDNDFRSKRNAPVLTDEEAAANKYYVWNESNYQADPATAWVLTTPE